MSRRKTVNASGAKPQIVRTVVNGKVEWRGYSEAARWISTKHGINCAVQTVINTHKRGRLVRPLTHADIVRQEYPEIFGIAK